MTGARKKSTTGTRPSKGPPTPASHDGDEPLVNRDRIQSLLSLRNPDPHSILGAHVVDGGVVIRILRPNAESISVVLGSKKRWLMKQIDASGLFETLIPELTNVPTYRLQVTYPGGASFTQHDA